MKNNNTLLLILAGAAIYYFYKQKNKPLPINKVLQAGMFANDAVQNSTIITPEESFKTQYKKDQAKCV